MELLHELKSNGLILNQDFEWRYQPTKIIETHDHKFEVEEKYCIIKFYNLKHLTFYSLKWNKYL